ncbi:MAG: hypothetical protein IID37_08345 [Planctomycetes bacterium]|nr:hypothetical protein [Planctomycetota bacterium]
MRAATSILGVVLPLLVMAGGCQKQSGCAGLSNLDTDSNNNGFFDLLPPDGVPFTEEQNLRITIMNTLTEDDLEPFAAQAGVSPSLVRLADFLVDFRFNIEYEDGSTQTICETEPLRAFEFNFEIACPTRADLHIDVIALAPVVGTEITRVPLELSLDTVDYECGQSVEFITTTDEDGELAQSIIVE